MGVALSGRRRFLDAREVVAVAAEMKAVAKQTAGSAVAIDRRTSSSLTLPTPAVEHVD
jgi:hypothetical protein